MTPLQAFINEMPHGKADEFRNKIVAACGITQALFRNWRNGLNVPEKYHGSINQIASEMFNQQIF